MLMLILQKLQLVIMISKTIKFDIEYSDNGDRNSHSANITFWLNWHAYFHHIHRKMLCKGNDTMYVITILAI